jgi:hypothetical protein
MGRGTSADDERHRAVGDGSEPASADAVDAGGAEAPGSADVDTAGGGGPPQAAVNNRTATSHPNRGGCLHPLAGRHARRGRAPGKDAHPNRRWMTYWCGSNVPSRPPLTDRPAPAHHSPALLPRSTPDGVSRHAPAGNLAAGRPLRARAEAGSVATRSTAPPGTAQFESASGSASGDASRHRPRKSRRWAITPRAGDGPRSGSRRLLTRAQHLSGAPFQPFRQRERQSVRVGASVRGRRGRSHGARCQIRLGVVFGA